MATHSADRSHTLRASFRLGGCALALVGAVALLAPACGGDDTTPPATGGSSGSGGTAGKGGSGGTGGSTDAGKGGSTAGASGSGGTTAGASGAGGAAGKGGAAGTAGTAGAAGKAGAGGAAGTAGAAGQAGAAGTAGTAGTGGSAGSAGTGGTAGSSGTGGGDAGPDVSSDGSTPDAMMCVDGGGPLAPDAAVPEAGPEVDNCANVDGGRIINPFLTCPDAAAPTDAGDVVVDPHRASSADDDDCKTHVTYSTSCIQLNQNVTFTVTQRNLTTSTNTTGGNPYIEAFIGAHPITNAGTTTENNGVYTISGVQFDRSGIWTVRFHFFANCQDGEDSKHTHVSFYVRVP